MNNEKEAISVIIPIFNDEKYLDKCIQSVVDQTYKNREIILVNDGSSDRSGGICDAWAEKDPRIRVIHQNNSGVSSARNAGLQAALGDYITFCDSDDEILPDYLFHLMEAPESYDLVISGFVYIDEKGMKKGDQVYPFQSLGEQDASSVLDLIGVCGFSNVWAKRFKRSMIEQHQIRFDSALSFAEDTLFAAEYTIRCQSILVLDSADYRYRKDGAAGLSSYTSALYEQSLKADEKILSVWERKYPQIRGSAQWKKREYPILRNCLLGTLTDGDIKMKKKIRAIQRIMNNPLFPRTISELENAFPGEGKRLIHVLRCRSAFLLLLFHHIYHIKTNLLKCKYRISGGKPYHA